MVKIPYTSAAYDFGMREAAFIEATPTAPGTLLAELYFDNQLVSWATQSMPGGGSRAVWPVGAK